jgi:nucleotide-binding universal stress UspA family protein
MSATTMKQTTRASSAKPKARISKILVPVDFEAPSNHALEYAKDLARQFQASLELLHVVSVPYILPVTDGGLLQLSPEVIDGVVKDANARLANAIGSTGETSGSRATVRTGDPRAQIVDFAREEGADLIVMGTRGRTGATHLIFGSVAEHVVRSAPCPVLTVR